MNQLARLKKLAGVDANSDLKSKIGTVFTVVNGAWVENDLKYVGLDSNVFKHAPKLGNGNDGYEHGFLRDSDTREEYVPHGLRLNSVDDDVAVVTVVPLENGEPSAGSMQKYGSIISMPVDKFKAITGR